MGQRQQTDNSAVQLAALSACLSFSNRIGANVMMVEGGTAGVVSSTQSMISAGISTIQLAASFSTPSGDPGTATWDGSCVMRWNITTANTNITWSHLVWSAYSASLTFRVCVTYTASLAIGLGTTGVKTASVGVSLFAANTTDVTRLFCVGSNAAAMSSSFGYLKNQLVDVPFTSSATAATTAIHSLTLLNNGT